MDPVRTAAVLAHRNEVQRAVFGPGYETGLAHFDRTQIRRQQPADACRSAL